MEPLLCNEAEFSGPMSNFLTDDAAQFEELRGVRRSELNRNGAQCHDRIGVGNAGDQHNQLSSGVRRGEGLISPRSVRPPRTSCLTERRERERPTIFIRFHD
jgi:hypothetical protein